MINFPQAGVRETGAGPDAAVLRGPAGAVGDPGDDRARAPV